MCMLLVSTNYNHMHNQDLEIINLIIIIKDVDNTQRAGHTNYYYYYIILIIIIITIIIILV